MNGNNRILVVDDVEAHRRLIGRVLRTQGFEVLDAGNSEQALEKLRGERTPHLVILDQMMPKQTGAAFWKQIQSDEAYKHVWGIPVIFITAYPEDEGVKELRAKGIPILAKPLSDYLDIANIVRDVLGQTKSLGDEILDALADAQAEEFKEQWVQALHYYHQVNGLIDRLTRTTYAGDPSKLPEPIKDQALECWIGYLRCQFVLRSRVSNMLIWDFPDAKELDGVERKIRAYKTKYPIKLWNELYQSYNALEIECNDKRMPKTADVFHHYAIRARRNLYYHLALRGEKDKTWTRRLRALAGMMSTSVELMLDQATVGILWSVLLMIALLVLFAFLYDWSGGIMFEDGLPIPSGVRGFLYALYFSVFVFTGTEPGALTTTGQFPITGLMVLESIFAFVFTVVVIGYVVNRLSSRY